LGDFNSSSFTKQHQKEKNEKRRKVAYTYQGK